MMACEECLELVGEILCDERASTDATRREDAGVSACCFCREVIPPWERHWFDDPHPESVEAFALAVNGIAYRMGRELARRRNDAVLTCLGDPKSA